MRRETIHACLLLLPALVLLVAFTHWPAIATLIDSLYATPRGSRPAPFVGIDNYMDLLDDPVFWQALRNNAWYAVATIPASIVLALLMALAVNEALPGRALLRMAYFLPTMLPMIAVANIWLFFYTPDYGLFDRIIAMFGGGRHNWLGDASTALPAMIAVAVWKEAGFFMIFYLAALADHADRSARGRRAGGFVALELFPPRHLAAADADHVVRLGQRGDQRVPRDRPYRGDDPRRPGQRHDTAAVLHL